MGEFRILPLGVGDAFSARYYSSCLALEWGGKWVLLDCPHPIRKMLHEASQTAGLTPWLDLDRIEGVLLTHLHADHCSGLEGLGFFSYFVLGRRAVVYAHPGVIEHLWDGCLKAGMGQILPGIGKPSDPHRLEDYFDVRPLDTTRPVAFGEFEVECRQTHHHIPTFAFRITTPGGTLSYSSDTSYDQELIDWLAPADLVIHETNLGIHTPFEKLLEQPEELRQRLRVIHYPDGFDPGSGELRAIREGEMVVVAPTANPAKGE